MARSARHDFFCQLFFLLSLEPPPTPLDPYPTPTQGSRIVKTTVTKNEPLHACHLTIAATNSCPLRL